MKNCSLQHADKSAITPSRDNGSEMVFGLMVSHRSITIEQKSAEFELSEERGSRVGCLQSERSQGIPSNISIFSNWGKALNKLFRRMRCSFHRVF